MQDTCVFISSSDNRRDVLDRVLPSLFKYWKDCPYPVRVGLNSGSHGSPNIVPVIAPVSDWRRELALQLRQIPHRRLILLLDDFLVEEPVSQERVAELLADFQRKSLSYLRLLPLGRSLGERIVLARKRRSNGIELISEDRPFYSSLQIAIWQREHLLAMLEGSGSIWDFEHQRIDGARHFAIADRPPFHYQHLVEKGRWQPYAKRLLRRAGFSHDLGGRPVWPGWAYGRVWLDELRWFLSGIANQ